MSRREVDQNQEAGMAAIGEVDGAEVGVTETCCVCYHANVIRGELPLYTLTWVPETVIRLSRC